MSRGCVVLRAVFEILRKILGLIRAGSRDIHTRRKTPLWAERPGKREALWMQRGAPRKLDRSCGTLACIFS